LKLLPSAQPFFDEASVMSILADVAAALKSGVLTNGPHVSAFEEEFARYVGSKHAVAVNSGTSNLEVALRHYGVQGREVIVPTNTFVATANAVVFAGGKPVFAEIREDTLCIDVEDVARRLTSRTAGVVVVHVAGLVCPQIDELRRLCAEHDLFLIEDCSHAHGAKAGARMAGTLGDAGCFSFYPTKVMTTGEGGMLVTEDDELAEAARVMRNHGQNEARLMVTLGHNWCMDEVSAIIGRHQLRQLELFVQRRNEIASAYASMLKCSAAVSLFDTPAGFRHSYYKFPVKLDETIDVQRLMSVLKSEYGVETGQLYYPPCHLQPYYRQVFGTFEGMFPVAEHVLKRVLCLPVHVGMTLSDVEIVVEAFDASVDALQRRHA
jgi:dTDP-4-amino-4,6-dideoxygalactose transaminase